LTLVTVKVNEELKRRMKKYPHVNWSEIIRRAIEERLRLEEALKERKINLDTLRESVQVQDRIREKTSGKWSATEEIRRWRELRK
jgi:hypothetical protein